MGQWQNYGKRLMRRVIVLAVAGIAALCAGGASAQENFNAILEREFVAHWLVLGPFVPDIEGGIAAALEAGNPPLGARDFLASLGGATRARPEAGQVVQSDAGPISWQAAGAEGVSFDLQPLFAGAPDGVAYVAFYTQAAQRATAYFDLQSPLGTRMWVNGTPFRDVSSAPISAAGVQRFVLTLAAGPHLFIVEVPVASYETLADGAGMSLRELGARGLANRTLLEGRSGFEFALRVQRAEALGPLYAIPALEDTLAFSGTADDIRQDVLLKIFNPQDTPATPVAIEASYGGEPPTFLETLALPPATAVETTLSIPVNKAIAGQSIPVSLTLTHGAAQLEVTDTVVAAPRLDGGRSYLVTGAFHRPESPEDQSAAYERSVGSFARQMVLRNLEPNYGFDLGPAAQWEAALVAYPEQRTNVLQAVGLDQLGAWAQWGRLDERLVHGELLVRNLQYGIGAANRLLQEPRLSFPAWELPGLAAQTPQLLSLAGIDGIAGNLDVPGLPPLFRHYAPDGSMVYHRRQMLGEDDGGVEALRDRIRLTRRAMAQRGIATDVLLRESVTPPPEPPFFGAAAALGNAYPPVLLRGGAAEMVFEDAPFLPPSAQAQISASARSMTAREPGSVVSQPRLKQAHAALLGKLRRAEFLATLAALWGAEYPGDALEYAWHQALYTGAPERLGLAAAPETYWDALAAIRDGAAWTDEVLRNAGTYAAAAVDTRSNAPQPPEGAQALVLFNPVSWRRSGVCSARIEMATADGFTLLDDEGNAQPFYADQIERDSAGRIYAARIRFTAHEVPGLGYRSYYVLPRGPLPVLAQNEGPVLENDVLRAEVDPATGAIVSLVDKASGTDFAAGALNEILALEEDPARTNGGRELWTTGPVLRASDTAPVIDTEVGDYLQRMTITSAFAGGTLTRRLTLYPGEAALYCETVLDGVALDTRFVVAQFRFNHEGRAPVHGIPAGFEVGRPSKGSRVFRSDGMDNLSGTAARPALHWAALTPNDAFRRGEEQVRPLAPAAILHGPDLSLRDAAETLEATLAARGIPSAVWQDTPHKADPFWEDGTEFLQFDGDLDHGTAMRICIGHPERNAFAAALVAALSEEARKEFIRRIPGGALLYLEDSRHTTGHGAVPTLLIAGSTTAESVALAEQVATSIAAGNGIVLGEADLLNDAAEAAPEDGVALLFDGTMLSSLERDGAMLLGLAHGPGGSEAKRLAFRYAIQPFAGTWRIGRVPQAAQAYTQPFVTVLTDIHAGTMPPTLSLLEFEDGGPLVSAVKPAGTGAGRMDPRNGIAVRLWEAEGAPFNGTAQFWAAPTDARMADFFELPGDAIKRSTNNAMLNLRPNELATLWVLPAATAVPGPRTLLAGGAERMGALPARYWRHNAGAAPAGGLPATVVLRDGVAGDDAGLEALVANPGPDAPIEGVLYLRAAEGWSVAPSHVYYNLAPGEYARHPVTLLQVNGPPEARGATAHTVLGGITVRDVLDAAPPPEVTVSRNLAQLKVTVRNRSGLPLEGHVDAITVPAHWPELGDAPGMRPLDDAVPVSVLPARAALQVAPYESREILFRVSDDAAALTGLLKVAANGRTVYEEIGE